MSSPQDVSMSDIKDKEAETKVKTEGAESAAGDSSVHKSAEGADTETKGKDEAKEEGGEGNEGKKDGDGTTDAAKPAVLNEDVDMEDVNPEENDIDIDFELEGPTQQEEEEAAAAAAAAQVPGPVPVTRKDKTLSEFLDNMNEYAPIIPDAVTDYYLAKSGFQTNDVRIKRLLALATQKFISDLASDAYQHSRIRSSSSVSSASNPQARAKALVAGVGGAQVQSSSSGRSKIVLTMEDLSSASSEYGLNLKRPDFYR